MLIFVVLFALMAASASSYTCEYLKGAVPIPYNNQDPTWKDNYGRCQGNIMYSTETDRGVKSFFFVFTEFTNIMCPNPPCPTWNIEAYLDNRAIGLVKAVGWSSMFANATADVNNTVYHFLLVQTAHTYTSVYEFIRKTQYVSSYSLAMALDACCDNNSREINMTKWQLVSRLSLRSVYSLKLRPDFSPDISR